MQAMITKTSLECSEANYLPISLTPSVNPKLKPFPEGSQESSFLMLQLHNKGNPTSPPPASMEEQTFIVVSAGGEVGCVNLLAPVHAALVRGHIHLI